MELMITQHDGIIEENFTEAKAYLASQLETYKSVVFTEDTKKDAKDTVAQLRKDKKAFQDKIKATKVEYMKPFDEFMEKANELLLLYDEPIVYINAQIEDFEQKRREEKREQIQDIYHELVPEAEWQEVIPLAKIANPKWENATATAKSIKEEIMQYKENAKTAFTAIKAMASDKEAEALEMYKRTLNLNECMDYLNRYEQQKKEVLERERQREQREAEERIRREEREKMAQEKITAETIAEAQAQAQEQGAQSVIEQLTPNAGGEEKEYTYMIRLTDDAKAKIEMYMDSVGIEYFCM